MHLEMEIHMVKKLGSHVDNSPATWVQTDRAAH